jgi:cytochrome P450
LAKELGHEFHLSQEAFIPFSYGMYMSHLQFSSSAYTHMHSHRIGPGNCIGRTVALKELRLVLASLVRHFDFKFVDGFDTNGWLNSQEDHGILTRESLPVVITRRMNE